MCVSLGEVGLIHSRRRVDLRRLRQPLLLLLLLLLQP